MRTRFRPPVAPPKPEAMKVVRQHLHNGCTIMRMENGENYVRFEKGGYIKVAGLEEGKKLIDETHAAEEEFEQAEPVIPPDPLLENEWPRGGYTKNPPETCEKRCKFEERGNWWVDNMICANYCKVNQNCRTWKEIQSRRQINIRRLGYETMSSKCPHCESEIAIRGLDQWVYSCGTVADKHSKTYVRKCGLAPANNRRRR